MRRRFGGIVTLLAMAALVAAGCGDDDSGSGTQTIRWYVFDEPSGAFDDGIANCNEQARGRYRIELVPLPTNADQQRELLVRRLAAEDDDIDIAGMDVIWTAEFAEAGWIRPVPERLAEELRGNTLEGPLETATYEDRVYGIPHNSNTQLLWYRKDRVRQAPRTWDAMIEQAREIGANGDIQVQGGRYEGFVVWFNTLVESAGGSIVDENGDTALGRPAVEAAEVINRLANSPAADPAISNSREDSARLAFQSGGSSFMVNYPFVYPSAEAEAPEVFENLGVALFPRIDANRPSEVTLGGINLGVSTYSRNPELAFEAATCLRNRENQIINTEKGGLPPTLEALYDAPEIREAYPGFADLMEQSIRNGVPRPVSPAYSDISLTIQQTLHPPGGGDPQATIDQLRDRLKEVEEGGIF